MTHGFSLPYGHVASQGALPEEKMVYFEVFLPVSDGKLSCLCFVQIAAN